MAEELKGEAVKVADTKKTLTELRQKLINLVKKQKDAKEQKKKELNEFTTEGYTGKNVRIHQ